MSRTLNKVMLIGNVGKDPELKHTPSGIPVASFRLATSESWRDKDGSIREHTDWHTIIAWRGLAEVIFKLLKKGSRVYIEGRIQTRSFDDKNNNRRHVVEILAENMLNLDNKKLKDNGGAYDSSSDNYSSELNEDINDTFDSFYYDDDYRSTSSEGIPF
ncbi:MAG TPA: single-stranded DNA-binding protein [Candidatus Kapabacteria bacterium]|nr:single-stranded DNA-binding protein [Candidatus Kapabacteria bacterium]